VGFTVYLVSTKPGMQISDLSNSFLTATFVVISLTILFLGLMAEWWVQYFYGKYAKEIKKVIDELKEE
jgi:predicted DNA-binding transcriptional regulator